MKEALPVSARVEPEGGQQAAATAGPEVLVSQLLRYGVATSVALILLGTTLTFLRHPDYLSSTADMERLARGTEAAHTLSDVLAGVFDARGRAVTMVGLLMLMGLPVARVGLSLYLFARQGDRRFVLLTSAVLGLLLLSLLLGGLEH